MIAIIRPLPISAIAAGSNNGSAPNMLSASPREVWRSASSAGHNIDIDLGSAVDFDTIYLGGLNIPADCAYTLNRATGMGAGFTYEGGGTIILPQSAGPRFQSIIRRVPGVATRYLRITLYFAVAQVIDIGIIAIGTPFRHAYAYGPGRRLVDMSRRTELIDGGFGIDEGAVKASFRWQFVDLDQAAADELWAMTYNRATRRPIVVIEDDSIAAPPEPTVHYGLFDKFEPWERSNAADTTWALSMTEWR